MVRRLIVGAGCMLAELILAGARPQEPQPEHVRASLLRQREPYFAAFLARSLTFVYGPKSQADGRADP